MCNVHGCSEIHGKWGYFFQDIHVYSANCDNIELGEHNKVSGTKAPNEGCFGIGRI